MPAKVRVSFLREEDGSGDAGPALVVEFGTGLNFLCILAGVGQFTRREI